MALSLVTSATSTSFTGTGPYSSTTTPGVDTTGATLLVGWSVTVPVFSYQTFTDNKSNAFISLTSQSDGANIKSRLSYKLNPAVGSGHTCSGDVQTIFGAFTGGAFTYVSEAGNANVSSATSINAGPITFSVGDFGVSGLGAAGTGTSAPTGYSGFQIVDIGTTPYVSQGMAWEEYGSGGADNITWTWSVETLSEQTAESARFTVVSGGGNTVSGGATEGADSTSGSVKVAIKASGGPTEGKDATSGTIKLASKVSGGATEGPDATAGSVKVALKVSGGVTEGADFTTGAISVGSTHVSGNLTEGADATGGGSVKVAAHVSGGPTEGKDATAGNLLVAVKVSGGVTEGADFTTGSITATSRTISGGFTEGADRTSGIIISGTVSQGGHFLPLTKKEIAEARKRAKAARDKEEAGWDQAAKDKADLHQQIMKTLHPEKILGTGKVEKPEEDDDEADIEMLLLYG